MPGAARLWKRIATFVADHLPGSVGLLPKRRIQAGLAEEGQEQTGDIVLTTTPTQHTIDVSSHAFTEVLSPFLWVTGSAPTYNQQVVFYVDDLVWE